MRLLVAGGAGFIGSTFLRLVRAERPDWELVAFDALTYAGNRSTIADLDLPFRQGWIQDADAVASVLREFSITHVVNFAAETHNDRSMLESAAFIQSNVVGPYVLLEAIRRQGIEKFVHVSTDEVYGTIAEGEFTEESPLRPNTPYSASKAGGDLQVRAHVKAYGTPAVVTRGGNTYGPYQFPEKLIPFFVTRLIDGKKVPVYGKGDQVREWIHARDHAAGVLVALERGEPGEIYNIGDLNERQNLEVVRVLLEETGRDESFVKSIPDPRGGAHDPRYRMSAEKLRTLGWAPVEPFEAGLRSAVRWYLENQGWWRPIVESDDYRRFVAEFYGRGLGEDL